MSFPFIESYILTSSFICQFLLVRTYMPCGVNVALSTGLEYLNFWFSLKVRKAYLLANYHQVD